MGGASHLGCVRRWRDDRERAFWSVESGRTRGADDWAQVQYSCTVGGAISRMRDEGGGCREWRNLGQRASLEEGTL